MKNAICIIIGIIVTLVTLLVSSHYGAKDRSFDVKDEVTGNIHSVTERSIEACKSMQHYSVVNFKGVDRRCVNNVKYGATTISSGG